MSNHSGVSLRLSAGFVLTVAAVAGIGLRPPPVPLRHDVTNIVRVVNIGDGEEEERTKTRLGWQQRQLAVRSLAATNEAIAISQCQDCVTEAAAFQIVLGSGVTGPVVPVNRAIAINTNCVRCRTGAVAYQFVVVGAGTLSLSERGWSALADLRRQAENAVEHPAPPAEHQARLASLAAQVHQVLATEVRTGPPRPEVDGPDVGSSRAPEIEVHSEHQGD